MKKHLIICLFYLPFFLVSQVPSYAPINGLEGWYSFSGNANDDSPNNNNGSVSGPVLVDDRFGNTDAAFYFDGTDDFISTLNAPFIEGPFSISSWVLINNFNTLNPTVSIGDLGGDHLSRMFFSAHNGNSGTPNIGTIGANGITSSDDVVTENQWFHVVVTANSYNVNEVSFYVNGVLLSGTNTTGGTNVPTPFNNAGFTVGKATGNTSTHYFGGTIDDVGLWSRELTTCEVVELYTAGMMTYVTQNGAQLTADQSGATYQWLHCDNNYDVILDETAQSFTPEETGNYALEVTMNGCSDTSECFLVDYTGISEDQLERINVYPNPTSDKLTVSSNISLIENSNYEIVNIYGQVISEAKLQEGVIDISLLPSGVYFLNIINNGGLEAVKFVKK